MTDPKHETGAGRSQRLVACAWRQRASYGLSDPGGER